MNPLTLEQLPVAHTLGFAVVGSDRVGREYDTCTILEHGVKRA
jgi:hypothetical protein